MPPTAQLVTGRAVLREPVEGGSTLHIYVEDVSRADAASVRAAALELPLAASLPAGAEVPFELRVEGLDPDARYEVRAHLDRSGNGEIESGDLVSVESHPVLTRGAPDRVDIALFRA